MTKFSILTVAITVGLASIAVASPASAAKTSPTVSVNASPEPITAGAYVKVAGKVGGTSITHNGGQINLYFKAHTASVYSYVAYTTATSAGYYAKSAKQNVSGSWKVKFFGNAYRNVAWSSYDYVPAVTTATVYSHSGTGNYRPSTLYAVTANVTMKAAITAYCDNTGSYNFVDVIWNSAAADAGSASSGYFYKTSPTIPWDPYITPAVSRGTIYITTFSDCHWTVKITQLRTV